MSRYLFPTAKGQREKDKEVAKILLEIAEEEERKRKESEKPEENKSLAEEEAEIEKAIEEELNRI